MLSSFSDSPMSPDRMVAPRWRVQHVAEVSSTNEFAMQLRPWEAVTAGVQHSGRGRYSRQWVSDEGGLWLSAVVPTPAPLAAWSILPLAAGWAVCEALTSFRVPGLHLRWPNDIMAGRTKLAGILVERYQLSSAVVGIGLNYANQPDVQEPNLRGTIARLVDLVDTPPTIADVRDQILAHLAFAHAEIMDGRAEKLARDLDRYWEHVPVRAALNRTHERVDGTFAGVDAHGRLHLVSREEDRWLEPSDVAILREIS